jgi:17beta-estradiol 17-dehydrogenase / very-long-chain 3-oxoacyl-CoA reductase
VGLVAARVALRILAAVYAKTLRPGKNLKKYGDWAVVTGATDGIGEAIAFECARKGLSVLLLSRTESKLQATSKAISEKYPKVRDYS